MENLLSRYRNVSILVAILFAQVLGLAIQVRRTSENESNRLIRVWATSAITPFERIIVWAQGSTGSLWRNYIYLRGVRQENRDLKYEIENLRVEQVRLRDDAEQARRLQSLLGFKEHFISKTVAAQVIGSSGSDYSRSVFIDKGSNEGIRKDMAVITADGVVGKILRADSGTSQVLLLDDQSSGVGAILEGSRLQGVLRGTPVGEVVLEKVLSDEQVQPGERVMTSGGDQIFPKGLPAGVVTSVTRGPEAFLNIRVRPAANLGRLEEVLVITEQHEKAPEEGISLTRAADILSQRLPSVPDKPVAPATPGASPRPADGSAGNSNAAASASPAKQAAAAPKAATTSPKPAAPAKPGEQHSTTLPGTTPSPKPKLNSAPAASPPAEPGGTPPQ